MRRKNEYVIKINLKNAVKTGAIAAVGYVLGSIAEQFIHQSISRKEKLKMYENIHGVIVEQAEE